MGIKKLGHIGIAAAEGGGTVDFFVKYLSGALSGRDEYPDMKQISSMVRVSGCPLEIMEPTGPDGVVGKYIAKHGQGIHHLSFEVEGIEAFAETLEADGIKIVGKQLDAPVKFMFIDPRCAGGVLIELYEPQTLQPNNK